MAVPLREAFGDFGGKTKNLRRLQRAGFRVPETWAISCDHYDRFLESGIGLEDLRNDLLLPLSGGGVAIRSSADVEDRIEASHAGEFVSILNVTEMDEAIEAVKNVWNSAVSERSEIGSVRMGVMIQRMVAPLVSGVAFSRDPVTGERVTLVEWTEGTGIDLVQRGMDVHHFRIKEGERRHEERFLNEVVKGARKAESLFGLPMDLEWTYDGKRLWWLQARPITTMRHIKVYSNRISREQLPGLIHPLVWSINIPIVNGAWIRLLSELLGQIEFRPEDLAERFFCRAYFNMGAMGEIMGRLGMPTDSLEILQGMEQGKLRPKPCLQLFMAFPRLLKFLVRLPDVSTMALGHISMLREECRRQDALDLGSLKDADLLKELDRLMQWDSEAAYWNILIPLLLQFKSRRGSRNGGNDGISLAPGTDPSFHLSRLKNIYDSLGASARARVRAGDLDVLEAEPELASEFREMMESYGHLSSSGNDISKPTWRERPELVMMMIPNQSGIIESNRKEPISLDKRDMNQMRDLISFEYTRAYGLLRRYYQEIGTRLVDRDLLDSAADVFFITKDEAAGSIVHGDVQLRDEVERRRDEMHRCREVKPPDIILGDVPPPLDLSSVGSLEGLGTSGGRYTGKAIRVRGLEDFNRVREGDVIFIPHSDVAWIPLFNIAGAIVAEAGGYLSHSSIIARELGLPAVVSISGAMSEVSDGMTVTVDGFDGIVTLH